MPTPLAWPLIGGPLPEVPAVGGGTAYATELAPPLVSLTQQDLLNLFDRLFPEWWLAPLKSPGPGYEALQAFAKMFERASVALATFGADAFITSAKGGSRATGNVELYRDSPNGEGISVTIKAGTVVTTSRGGRDFVTLADVTFAPADVGPYTVAVEAPAVGYEWNVPGVALALDGTVLPGEIDTIKTLVEDPQMGDLSIRVRQLVATSGGRDAALDQLGEDRGLPRVSQESDGVYRARISTLPDTISPDAATRAAWKLLEPVKGSFAFLETWAITYQTCYDAPPASIPGATYYDPNMCVYDDPTPTLPFQNRWMDESEHRGCFILLVENLQPLSDYGMCVYPDPTQTFLPVAGQTGLHATLAAGSVAPGTPAGYQSLQVGGLSGMTAASVGRFLTLSGAAQTANNGTFPIVAYVSANTVEIANAAGVIPDANSGNVVWTEASRVLDEADLASLVSPKNGGLRALCAYDIDSTMATGFLHPAWDGYDAGKRAVYQGLWNDLQSLKAAGTVAALELAGQ